MKRSLQQLLTELGALSREELGVVLRESQCLYAQQCGSLCDIFLEIDPDGAALLQLVLTPLAHTEPLNWMHSLRLVCRDWRIQIRRLPHLRLGRNVHWSSSIYESTLTAIFPCVTSLHSHQRILAGTYEPVYARLTRLQIEPVDNEECAYPQLSVHGWTSLQTLIFPYTPGPLLNLYTLTSLTQLEIHGDACPDGPEQIGAEQYAQLRFVSDHLTCLVNLRHLVLQEFSRSLNTRAFIALRHLESDCGYHFEGFTGTGQLKVFDIDANDEYGEDGGGLAVYQEGITFCNLQGAWVEGRFSGRVAIQYHEGERMFWGQYVDNKRHGPGEEMHRDARRRFYGEWLNGKRHGPGRICTWLGPYCSLSEDDDVLLSTEVWTHGELTEKRARHCDCEDRSACCPDGDDWAPTRDPS